MSLQPIDLKLTDQGRLLITWSDGQRREYAVRELRDACPCASCREKRAQPEPPPGQLPVLSAAETQPMRLAAMKPVGHYAYSLRFSDGHDTGIYTFAELRQLGKEVTGA